MTTHCHHCQDRLLDYAYGLLDANELQETRTHLDACSDCVAALEEVRSQQNLFARAARAITEVAEFTLPSDKPAPVPQTIPFSAAPPSKRSRWRRAWVGWAAAASVLLAVSAAFSYHRAMIHSLQDTLAERRQETKEVAAQLSAIPAKYEALHQLAVLKHRANAGPYLHVVGPTTLQAGARAHLHVTTRHIEGEPAQSNIRIKLIDADTGNSVQVLRLQTERDGHALVELDASNAKPNSVLNLMVEAESGLGQTRIQETLRIQPSAYVTRIDTNKVAYQLQDVLFFRVLVLDRYTLQPPSQPIAMRVELLDPAGKVARTLEMSTGAGGVLAREFAIVEKFLAGSYTLNVRPIDVGKAHVQAASQRLEVVRELRVPDIQFDKDHYLPGDVLSGLYRGTQAMPEKAMINNVPVPLTIEPQYAATAPGGGGIGLNTPKAKKGGGVDVARMQRFSAPIPANLPAGPNGADFTLPLQGVDKKKTELRTNIPLGPTDFSIDFFPEGGDLIAGVQNRVFYRVRSKSGEAVKGDGQVILMTSKNDIVDSSYQLGMGYLDFTPAAKETYTVRITTPAKIENVSNPFAKLGIRNDGVVVHVPTAVGNQGDAIRMTLRQQGAPRKLLVLAKCRDQIVDQRWVELKHEPVDLTLQPTQEASGMIRVTAYELKNNAKQASSLEPVAERLVYRVATHRLDLGFTLNTQQLMPGPVSAKTSARDEKGQPAAAWMLASVIDERFQARPRSLSAHFMLLNEIRTGPDMDDAQLILHDSPDSAQMLERFLGTHGWRRFVLSQEGEKTSAQPQIFSRENMPLAVMQQQYEAALAQVLKPIHTKGYGEQLELQERQDSLATAVRLAAMNLADFEVSTQLWIRLGLGSLRAVLLGISLILMGFGVYRIIRAHKTATPAFGSAFACLAVCLGVSFVGSRLDPIDPALPPGMAAMHVPDERVFKQKLDEHFANVPAIRLAAGKATTGDFALHASRKEDQQVAKATAIAEKIDKDWAKNATMAFARRDRGETYAFSDRKNDEQSTNPAMKRAFETARKFGEEGGKGVEPTPPKVPSKQPLVPVPVPPIVPNHLRESMAAPLEYFHQHVPNLQADTLLWHPTHWLANGSADVRFDIGSGNTTYRVLLLGHSPTGRFGFFETRLDVVGR